MFYKYKVKGLEEEEEVIIHYGVKGMKWGVRKKPGRVVTTIRRNVKQNHLNTVKEEKERMGWEAAKDLDKAANRLERKNTEKNNKAFFETVKIWENILKDYDEVIERWEGEIKDMDDFLANYDNADTIPPAALSTGTRVTKKILSALGS